MSEDKIREVFNKYAGQPANPQGNYISIGHFIKAVNELITLPIDKLIESDNNLEKIKNKITINEVYDFVQNWLWNEKVFGEEFQRKTKGMVWESDYMYDCTQMIIAYVKKLLTLLN